VSERVHFVLFWPSAAQGNWRSPRATTAAALRGGFFVCGADTASHSARLMDWSNFVSGVVGAAVGGFFATHAADKAHNFNLELQEYQRRKELDGILLAISIELTLAGDIYGRGTGALLDKLAVGESFHGSYFRLRGEFFQVYKGHVGVLGQLEDEETCRAICEAHTMVNALIEVLHINNEYLDRLESARVQRIEDGPRSINACISHLVQHLALLKETDSFCRRATANALALIREYRVKRRPVRPEATNFWAKFSREVLDWSCIGFSFDRIACTE
jgi:hypothetical protein